MFFFLLLSLANSLFAASSVSAGSAKNITTTKVGKSASSCPVYSPGRSYSSGQCVADMDHLFISLGNVPEQVPTHNGLSPPNYPLNRHWLIVERPGVFYTINKLANKICNTLENKEKMKKWMNKLKKICVVFDIDNTLSKLSPPISLLCSITKKEFEIEKFKSAACDLVKSITTAAVSSASNVSKIIVDQKTEKGSPELNVSSPKEELFNEDGDLIS